jgi:squalene synthase HpnC
VKDVIKATEEERVEARRTCERIARSHYENFLIVSLFVPRELHQHVFNIYAFARTADDFSDELDNPVEARARLDDWEQQLRSCYAGKYKHPIFLALSETIREFQLPEEYFLRLLKAFKQDLNVRRYATFADLLAYCENSANPVGRLYLCLFGAHEEKNLPYSDAICTALQLTNFWQDVSVDWEKGRLYIPLEDLNRFGVKEEDFASKRWSKAMRALLQFEVDRTEDLFREGIRLTRQVPPRLRKQVELFVGGGRKILEAIRKLDYNVLEQRPQLSKWDQISLLGESLLGF